jgi:hypothetical protein
MEHKLFKIDNFIKKDKDNSFNENYYDNCIKKNEINNNFNLINNKGHSLCLDNNSNEYYNYFNVIHSINKNENINIGKNKKEKSSAKKSKNTHKKTLKINSRSSKYRGVSKNGNKWQVHIMINKKNKYIGIYDSEEIAARKYDLESIKKNGQKAITNFKYNLKGEII